MDLLAIIEALEQTFVLKPLLGTPFVRGRPGRGVVVGQIRRDGNHGAGWDRMAPDGLALADEPEHVDA